MILEEWNTEDAIAVARDEGREEGLELGLEKGKEEKGIEIARKALAEGYAPEAVQKITGLDIETINKINKQELENNK